MASYRFSVIVPAPQMSSGEMLDMTDALGNAGCLDASIRGHRQGVELLFERAGDTLQSVIASALADVESAGYRVSKVELERESILFAHARQRYDLRSKSATLTAPTPRP